MADGPSPNQLCAFTCALHTEPAEGPGHWLAFVSTHLAAFFAQSAESPAACWMMDAFAESAHARWCPHAFAGSCDAGSVSGRLFRAEFEKGFPSDDARGPHVRAFGVPQRLCLPRARLYLNGTWESSSYRALCERVGVHDFIRCVHPLDGPAPSTPRPDETARRCLVIEVQGHDPGWQADDTKAALLEALSNAVASAYDHRFLRLDRARAELMGRISPAAHPVLPLLAEGHSETEIGKRIYRSVHTVHDHVKQIYKALGISSRIELRDLWMGTREPEAPDTGTKVVEPAASPGCR